MAFNALNSTAAARGWVPPDSAARSPGKDRAPAPGSSPRLAAPGSALTPPSPPRSPSSSSVSHAERPGSSWKEETEIFITVTGSGPAPSWSVARGPGGPDPGVGPGEGPRCTELTRTSRRRSASTRHGDTAPVRRVSKQACEGLRQSGVCKDVQGRVFGRLANRFRVKTSAVST